MKKLLIEFDSYLLYKTIKQARNNIAYLFHRNKSVNIGINKCQQKRCVNKCGNK